MSSQKPNTNTRTTKASYVMNLVKQEKSNVQTQNKFQVLGSIPSNQSKPTFAQESSSQISTSSSRISSCPRPSFGYKPFPIL